jgi:hypothetical protein
LRGGPAPAGERGVATPMAGLSQPGTFHSAVIVMPGARFEIRCHVHHPLIAFVAAGSFVDPPSWSEAFAALGFRLLSREVLELPLSRADTTGLAGAEWVQIRYWQPETVGEVLFNCWD